jgi:hypothetical protein
MKKRGGIEYSYIIKPSIELLRVHRIEKGAPPLWQSTPKEDAAFPWALPGVDGGNEGR